MIPLIVMMYALILMIPKYDTFAWFTAQSYADGKITNAKTADLINIHIGEVQYLENCNVQISVKVTNISNIDIPIKLDLLNNNKETHSKTKILKQGQSLMIATKDTNYPPSCEVSQITYHLFGFKGYIDEDIVIPLSSAKMIKLVEQPKKLEENKADFPKTEEKQQPEVKKEESKQPIQPEQPATETSQQDQSEQDTATPIESAPTQTIESPKITNQENKQPSTPANQTIETLADVSKENAQKDA
jgi:hypothetical protein